ncbi:unnamed protein product [Linum trigynum]|uniref:SBP-type domain-containing protein n=2 Tax=Linum trigynum TaxID=586398 RepID=A0AAV2CKH8_9ROSI
MEGKGKQRLVLGRSVKKELTGDVGSSDDDGEYQHVGYYLEHDSEASKKTKLVISASASCRGGRKAPSGGGGGGGMRCCQAENCTTDLVDAKPYHRRHKVCEYHSKAQVVLVAGMRQRFCQQCSRFHELSEFDDMKRSCRRRLAGHNERRRKNAAEPHHHHHASAAAAEEGSSRRGVVVEGQLQDIMCGQVGDHSSSSRARIKIATIQENPTYKHFQIR